MGSIHAIHSAKRMIRQFCKIFDKDNGLSADSLMEIIVNFRDNEVLVLGKYQIFSTTKFKLPESTKN
ncbi:hypothetical protein IC582_028868 [Cucumis melo]